MKVLKLGIVGLCVIGFTGCGLGSKNIVPYNVDLSKAKYETIRLPELNSKSKVDIGSNMYEKIHKYTSGESEVFIEQAINLHTFAAGKFTTSSNNLGTLKKDSDKGWKAACVPSTATGYTICLFDSNNDLKFDKIGAANANTIYEDLKPNIPYVLKAKKSVYDTDSFKYIALYQGKKGNTIKISFREFKDNMARPAFTQDIEYELDNDGKTLIGFKGLRIEVEKATNFDITYKIIKDYN